MAKKVNDLLASLSLRQDILQADKHALDDEFEEHPQSIFDVTEAIAEAERERDMQKVDVAESEMRAREAVLARNRETKVLAKDLDMQVLDDAVYKREAQDLIDCEYKIKRLNGLLKALEAKTSALKHLSELAQSSYFVTSSGRTSDPSPRAKRGSR